MATPFLAGLAVAAAALAGRYGIQAWQAFKTRQPKPRLRKFYEGGFQPTMTKREAALILGVRVMENIKKGWAYVRESATAEQIKEAHRRVMIANHPDGGGSHYLAYKINEAKDVMLGKTKGSGSAFS
ncbi:mitochondrial import inner membrane translocase subunit TIM14-1-like isoform X2 [Carica papaya]|uniref:mitochondrial import inner membrane translocase subunit TIM14-1-like isoform X2 n=1 Tax=Carica papaya TaxID=3649 RepID=UPI000B8CCA1A|nr:mitochondrial import inner membrane translocase subunit TIM14-1-like isoform X2 [Carica papaya]